VRKARDKTSTTFSQTSSPPCSGTKPSRPRDRTPGPAEGGTATATAAGSTTHDARTCIESAPASSSTWPSLGSNTLPTRIDPPQARNVRELYTELWSTPGPEGILPSAEPLPDRLSIGVGGFLAPIGNDEIIRRLARIKTSTAVGLDKVTKAHLRKPGAVTVLAKIMTAALLTRHFANVARK